MRIPLCRVMAHHYRYTFLTKPRGYTQDEAKADRSFSVYGDETEYGAPGWWATSWLGCINGVLGGIGLSLQALVGEPVEMTGSDGERHSYRFLYGYALKVG